MFALTDRELKAHINALQAERNLLKQYVVPSVGECNTLIAIAHAELSSRASDRMGKRAIWLSVAAIFTTLVASIFPMLTGYPPITRRTTSGSASIKLGIASCRERVCQYVYISVVA